MIRRHHNRHQEGRYRRECHVAARRFYERTPPAPGYILALWRPDGTLIAYSDGATAIWVVNAVLSTSVA